ncbi:transposase [Bacteroides cellulosilyticus]|uniref:transposase n=1 Tax=Bacteroides cellulosilyticus TaxID=246787 RepID=UPI00189F0301
MYFLPPYSPELNPIEILWRFIKYTWMPLDAFKNLNNLKERLTHILSHFGKEYDIKFS